MHSHEYEFNEKQTMKIPHEYLWQIANKYWRRERKNNISIEKMIINSTPLNQIEYLDYH